MFATRCSLTEKMVISSMVIIRSCTGLVLPRTAPNEIRTVAVLKSALIILREVEETSNVLFIIGRTGWHALHN